MGRTDNKTLRITQGALLSAVLGAFVLLNRQTAGLLQDVLVCVYALPITVYTAWYGFKTGIAAAGAMVILSFLLGTPRYAFYSCTGIAVGLIFGECIYRKYSPERTVLWIIMASIASNLLNIVFVLMVSGISLNSEAEQMLGVMNEGLEMYGGSADEESLESFGRILTVDTVRRVLLVTKVIVGAVQGVVTYLIGSFVMRKLQIKVSGPRSLRELRPPVWTGYAAAAGYLITGMLAADTFRDNENAASICMVTGTVLYIYLLVFGTVGLYVILNKYVMRQKAPAVLLSILAALILPYPMMLVGFVYLIRPHGIFAMPEEN